ncbi:MAG: Ppx/GppA family phosphatase [Pseudomonadota bacterium]
MARGAARFAAGSSLRLPSPAAQNSAELVGVIDTGSNSVRLVVYDGLRRTPIPLFNEKVFCGLGESVLATGGIGGEAAESCRGALRRFAAILRAMEVHAVEAVATAASREAANGKEFIQAVSREIGIDIRIISGADEGRFSALGVLAGNPKARGLAGDLGGGSIELVSLKDGAPGKSVTLPLGPLKMKKSLFRQMEQQIDERLGAEGWLKDFAGETLYAVGGSWRALAQAHMFQKKHPIRVIHEYAIEAPEALRFTRELFLTPQAELDKTPGLSSRRSATAAPAAAVLNRLVRETGVRRVVFSAYGLREGLLFTRLPEDLQAQDPLVTACEEKSGRLGRFPDHAEEITSWTSALFENESVSSARLRHCASLLSDIGWRVHPDHRADQCLMEVLHSPLAGVSHRGRALLALAVYFRYRAEPAEGLVGTLMEFVGKEAAGARLLGLALRLAHTLTGGTGGILNNCPLHLIPNGLRLRIPAKFADLDGEVLRKRLRQLAKALNREALLEIG